MQTLFVRKYINEKFLFYAVLLFNIYLLFTVRYYPSMDGAGHLYNARLIGHLLKGDSATISEFFRLNPVAIPNWFCYFILSVFDQFLPAWIAEKILLLFYLVGITFSFRMLIKQLCPGNLSVSIIIFPFAFNFLFHLGFYNYSLSFIFMFLTLAYWIRHRQQTAFSKYAVMLLLLTLTYFSAILTFAFTGICLGMLQMFYSARDFSGGTALSRVLKQLFREFLIFLITALPGIILSVLFIKATVFSTEESRFSSEELVKWLNDVRCLIVFDYKPEEKWTGQILHILIAMVSIGLFARFYGTKADGKNQRLMAGDIFLVPLILTLILLFSIPNASNAGMMSDRFCLQAYLFFILWACTQPLPYWSGVIFNVLIVVVHIQLLLLQHDGAINGLDKDATTIAEASRYIEKNSVVLPVNMNENWLQSHFANYLGIDKPLVVLENYEATVGWFPVKWTNERMPRAKLGMLDSLPDYRWPSNLRSEQVIQIDYVFIYGNARKVNEPQWSVLKGVLDSDYTMIYTAESFFVSLYRKKVQLMNSPLPVRK